MKFIHPNEFLAQKMFDSAKEFIADDTMLTFSVEEIIGDLTNWFAGIGEKEELTGFFCIRTPHSNFTEIGSVRSLVKDGLAEIIKEFETRRTTDFGCAITKDYPEKFINLTNGALIKPFPTWYQRDPTDKHFVQWS